MNDLVRSLTAERFGANQWWTSHAREPDGELIHWLELSEALEGINEDDDPEVV